MVAPRPMLTRLWLRDQSPLARGTAIVLRLFPASSPKPAAISSKTSPNGHYAERLLGSFEYLRVRDALTARAVLPLVRRSP
jgi:cell division FtsZ-interacting protein ZapD